ncbi:MAG: sulfite exporter TauE/SafE family protein [Sedimentitalea sp.]
MLEFDLMFFAIGVPAVLFAGVSKGGFGSGASFASASILALYLEPGLALGVMLPMLMLIDLSALRPYWKRWHWSDARLLIAGGVPGVALGALLYEAADADLLRLLIGAISIGFVAWQLGFSKFRQRMNRARLPAFAGLFAGLVAGFTSFISHAGGPPAAVYLLSQKLDKTQYQATTVLVFWVLNIVKFVPYAFLGLFTMQTLLANVVLAPFAVLGTWMGVRAHQLVPERLFFAMTYALLLATGSKLIWDALV